MLKFVQGVNPLILLVIATTLEVSGDAVLRIAIFNHAGVLRIALFLAGAALLFGYGSFLNLAPRNSDVSQASISRRFSSCGSWSISSPSGRCRRCPS